MDVIGATECAVEIHTVMAERNLRVPESRRMRFRIGINLGAWPIPTPRPTLRTRASTWATR